MNNVNSVKGHGIGTIYQDRSVYLDFSMIITKSEFSELETTAKPLGMGNMRKYCKYSMLKIANARSYEM